MKHAIRPEPAADTMPDRRRIEANSIIGDEITIRTVQGIGDIFWVYQKFAPYFNRINFTIYVTKDELVQRRAVDWLSILPKFGTAAIEIVSNQQYDRAASRYSRMQDRIDDYKAGRPVEYSINRWLEEGHRIDEIDPGAKIETDVGIDATARPETPAGDYLTLYVSGSATNKIIQRNPKYGSWDCRKWARLTHGLLDRIGNLPIVMIGASFDRPAIEEMHNRLTPRRSVFVMIDQPPAHVCGVLKHSKYFVGYQSGMNIVADALGARQIMLYFNFLRPMFNTWCRREHIGGKFQPACFEDDTAAIIERAATAWGK